MTSTWNSLRKFVYAGLLALTMLNFAPSLASGQEAGGTFTLSHDVRWGSITVPAGEYRFSLESDKVARVLTLTELNPARKSFFLLVGDTDDAKPTDHNQLVLKTAKDGTSYVSAMQLPELGVTLRFATPAPLEKQIARTATPTSALGQ